MTDSTLDRRAALSNRISQLERMMEIRMFEDRTKQLFADGLVHGTTHTAQGQEAVAVGLAASIRPTDVVTCTYRGHGIALALGMTPSSVLGEIGGRTTGAIGGVGGSMHLCGMDVGLLPTFAIVGAGIPVAAGAALTAQVRQTDGIAVAVFGDGATNIGAFHEALNLAAIWNLPVLFLCENNVYGEYSRYDLTTKVPDLAVRADSYGIRSVIVDGQDLDRVVDVLTEESERLRRDDGPVLVEAKTYRYAGHSRADTAPYRPPGEFDEWLKRDPIDTFASRLVAERIIDESMILEMRERLAEGLETVVEEMLNAPRADVGSMFRNVWASPIIEGPGRDDQQS